MSQTDNLIDEAEPERSDDDKPDPSEVAALDDDAGVYERDADGDLIPVEDVVKWDGEWHKVEHEPIAGGDSVKLMSLGMDISAEKLCNIMAEKYLTPDRTAQEWADTDPQQFNACLDLLSEKVAGDTPDRDMHAEVRKELEERGGDELGNFQP